MSRWKWPTITRDGVLFAFGLGGIVNEAIIRSEPTRPELLVLFAGMVGLPVALRRDEGRRAIDVDDDAPVGT
jgi:hypothetical protein